MRLTRVLVATAAAATMGIGVSALAAPAAVAAPGTVIINCAGKPATKPKQITLSCADGAIAVTNITWTSWTANHARGTGTLVWNTCLPQTCAAGIVQKYEATVSLGRIASGPSITVFSRMTLAFPQTGPAGANTASYLLDNMQH